MEYKVPPRLRMELERVSARPPAPALTYQERELVQRGWKIGRVWNQCRKRWSTTRTPPPYPKLRV